MNGDHRQRRGTAFFRWGLVALSAASVSAASLAGCRSPSAPEGRRSAPARPSAGNQAALPPERLPASSRLPDPLVTRKGAPIRTAAEWRQRRRELQDLLELYQYGHAPPPPGPALVRELQREPIHEGRALKRVVRLSLGPEHRLQLYLGLIVPAGQGPFPTVLHVDHRGMFAVPNTEEIVARGYALVGYDPTILDPDEPGAVGPAQAAYPGHDWATLSVWAWGAMRALDYLLTLREVDRQRVIITGHSRSGKTALLAGALDERIALVAPQGSGCGGAATYRYRGERPEMLGQMMASFPHWLQPRLQAFAGREERLPFDQHFVLALVAPRALLTIDALGDLWANPYGTQMAHLAVRPVYELLGARERLGVSFRPGEHELREQDWRTLLDFADQVLRGRATIPPRRFDELPFPVPASPL